MRRLTTLFIILILFGTFTQFALTSAQNYDKTVNNGEKDDDNHVYLDENLLYDLDSSLIFREKYSRQNGEEFFFESLNIYGEVARCYVSFVFTERLTVTDDQAILRIPGIDDADPFYRNTTLLLQLQVGALDVETLPLLWILSGVIPNVKSNGEASFSFFNRTVPGDSVQRIESNLESMGENFIYTLSETSEKYNITAHNWFIDPEELSSFKTSIRGLIPTEGLGSLFQESLLDESDFWMLSIFHENYFGSENSSINTVFALTFQKDLSVIEPLSLDNIFGVESVTASPDSSNTSINVFAPVFKADGYYPFENGTDYTVYVISVDIDTTSFPGMPADLASGIIGYMIFIEPGKTLDRLEVNYNPHILSAYLSLISPTTYPILDINLETIQENEENFTITITIHNKGTDNAYNISLVSLIYGSNATITPISGEIQTTTEESLVLVNTTIDQILGDKETKVSFQAKIPDIKDEYVFLPVTAIYDTNQQYDPIVFDFLSNITEYIPVLNETIPELGESVNYIGFSTSNYAANYEEEEGDSTLLYAAIGITAAVAIAILAYVFITRKRKIK